MGNVTARPDTPAQDASQVAAVRRCDVIGIPDLHVHTYCEWHVKCCLSTVFTECAPGSYGDACSEMCRCQNGGTCHHILGTCQCAPGWEGDKCESACVAGTFGVGCTEVCRCPQGEPCNHVTGQCDCPPGFTGYSCELRKSLFGKKKK